MHNLPHKLKRASAYPFLAVVALSTVILLAVQFFILAGRHSPAPMLQTFQSSLLTKEHHVEHWSQYYVDPLKVHLQYTIQPTNCSYRSPNTPTFVIIAVISRPNDTSLRQAVRDTWGSLAVVQCGVRLIFMFGKVYDEKTQQILHKEAAQFDDMLQSNQFDDVYRASGVKTMQFYQWVAAFCSGSVFAVRVDDDNWLNLPRYFKFLQASRHHMAVLGSSIPKHGVPSRNPNYKYYTPREEYKPDRLPGYVSGSLFAVPTPFLPILLHESLAHQGSVFADDAYVVATLARAVGIKYRHVPGYELYRDRVKNSKCLKRDQMCLHYRYATDFYALWNDSCHEYKKLC